MKRQFLPSYDAVQSMTSLLRRCSLRGGGGWCTTVIRYDLSSSLGKRIVWNVVSHLVFPCNSYCDLRDGFQIDGCKIEETGVYCEVMISLTWFVMSILSRCWVLRFWIRKVKMKLAPWFTSSVAYEGQYRYMIRVCGPAWIQFRLRKLR